MLKKLRISDESFLKSMILGFWFFTFSLAFALTIGYYDNYPLTYDEGGKPKGLFIDVLKKAGILEKPGVIFLYGEFSELVEKLKNGEIDLLVAVAQTTEREKIYTFNTEPVVMNWGVLVSLKPLGDLSLLRNKLVAVNRGDIYYQQFKELIKTFDIHLHFVEVSTYEEVMHAVDSGEVEAGVVSRLAYITNSTKYSKVRATPFIFSPVQLKFAMKRGADTSPFDSIDKTIVLMKSNGELDKLFNKYYGIVKSENKFSWSIFLLLILIFVYFLTIFSFNRVFKRIKYRYEAALEGYKKSLVLSGIVDETRSVYHYNLGQVILNNYIALSKRENHALCIVAVEFYGDELKEKKMLIESALKSLIKEGDFIMAMNEQLYILVLYQYGVFFVEVFRKKLEDMIERQGINVGIYIGAKQYDFSAGVTADMLVYEAIAEVEKDKEFRKKIK